MSDSGHVIGENNPDHPNFINWEATGSRSSDLKGTPPPEKEKLSGEEIAIEVLREHVAFLQDMLLSRDDYWRKECERLKAENDQLARKNSKLRVYLAEASEFARHAQYAAEQEQTLTGMSDERFNEYDAAVLDN